MNNYKLDDFVHMLGAAMITSRDLSTSDQLEQPIADDEFCRALGLVLDGVQIGCHQFEADPVLLVQLEEFATELTALKTDRRAAVIRSRLETILHGVTESLGKRKFLFIPQGDVVFWENPLLFGPAVRLVFQGPANDEIQEAGSCYAAGRNTACVFHCMRVAEYALRLLARNVKITLTHKGKAYPIEYAEWDQVITQIKNKISAARQLTRGKPKDDVLRFYSSAADHCEYMKDIWRNEVSHTRRLYSRAESLGVLQRVSAFTGLIAQYNFLRALKKYGRDNPELLTEAQDGQV